MFKKGSFEIGTKVFPIAMKYDSRFGDAFWNSNEQSYFEYILQMMTSWALICHVWYLPPMEAMVNFFSTAFTLRIHMWTQDTKINTSSQNAKCYAKIYPVVLCQ